MLRKPYPELVAISTIAYVESMLKTAKGDLTHMSVLGKTAMDRLVDVFDEKHKKANMRVLDDAWGSLYDLNTRIAILARAVDGAIESINNYKNELKK